MPRAASQLELIQGDALLENLHAQLQEARKERAALKRALVRTDEQIARLYNQWRAARRRLQRSARLRLQEATHAQE